MSTTETLDRRWNRVKWTETGQIVALLDGVTLDPDAMRTAPGAWWADRVAAGELSLATRFLAMALPRLEAIGWAVQMLERAGVATEQESEALAGAKHWLDASDDTTRRAAWDAAEQVAEGPARFIGAAIFFSGGSIAPADCGAVPPPPETCGVATAATILGAAARATDADGFLRAALDTGAGIATGAAG